MLFRSIRGQFSKYKPPGGFYLEGRFNGGFFALPVWGAYPWRGLFSEFYGILNFSYRVFKLFVICKTLSKLTVIYAPSLGRL